MNARDLLGLIIRVCGLGLIGTSVFDFLAIVERLIGFETARPDIPLERIVVAAAFYLLFGLCVVITANLIVRLTYGRDGSNTG